MYLVICPELPEHLRSSWPGAADRHCSRVASKRVLVCVGVGTCHAAHNMCWHREPQGTATAYCGLCCTSCFSKLQSFLPPVRFEKQTLPGQLSPHRQVQRGLGQSRQSSPAVPVVCRARARDPGAVIMYLGPFCVVVCFSFLSENLLH